MSLIETKLGRGRTVRLFKALMLAKWRPGFMLLVYVEMHVVVNHSCWWFSVLSVAVALGLELNSVD